MFPRRFSLSRVLRFYESFQVIEARCPEHAVLLDPGIDRTQGLRIQLVNAMPPFAMFLNQVGPSQQSQVLRDCRPRNRKGAGNLPAGWLPRRSRSSTARRVGSAKAWKVISRPGVAAGCVTDRSRIMRNYTVT